MTLMPQPNGLEWAEREGAPTPLASLTTGKLGASPMATAHPTRAYLTAEYLRSILDYDPATGIFMWRERPDKPKWWNTRYAGRPAGYTWRAGARATYRVIRISDWPFLAHRLAWLYVHGEWPDGELDHIDGDGTNNRFSNLRPATHRQNAQNAPRQWNNKSGYKGVCLVTGRTDKWRASIRVQGRQTHLGHFDSPEEAHAAYIAAAKQFHGEFARAK